MSDPSARTFSSDFRRFFLRGLVILLPSVLTLWIVVKAYQFVDTAIAEPINRGVRLTMNNAARYSPAMQGAFDPTVEQLNAAIADRAVERRILGRDQARRQLREQAPGEPPPSDEAINAAIAARQEVVQAVNIEGIRTTLRQAKIDEWWAERWYMNLIGLIIAIVAVYTAGRLLGGFVGRRIYARIEGFLTSIPIFKQVYPYIKQIVDFLFSEDQQPMKFNRVVAIEYPRRGIWSVGFMTGPTLRSIAERSGATVTVFIPSSPTPFTGYTITVPAEEVVELPISVEEAIRFAVSGGVLVPEHQSLPTVPPLATDRPEIAAPSPPSRPATECKTPEPVAGTPPDRAGSSVKKGRRRRSQRQVNPKT
jgi:uncharacterized membrane protein